jgi:predicted nucleic acid-binding protein
VISVSGNLKVILKDPDDNIVLLTAVNGKADYIVSGDKHLLTLRKFEGIEIGNRLSKLTHKRHRSQE